VKVFSCSSRHGLTRAYVFTKASTVSETDCIVRNGNWWGREDISLPNTPGVDVVGRVYHIKQKITSQFDLHPRQTVLSLVKRGGNTRYMSLSPDKLVKVPESVDPAQAACLPETYLTAFQVLHFGQVGSIRYRQNSLKGKSLLIVGSMANNMGKAIIELALKAGAANIYATAKRKHWKTLMSFGIMPLSQDPFEWISRIEGTIDLVLATSGGLREDVTQQHYKALRPNGHLILSGTRVVGNDLPVGHWQKQQAPLMCSKNKALTRMMNQSHSYDVYEQWEKDLDTCKKDLDHLLTLLEHGGIKPTILDRIPLNKVARAHELVESKRLSGFLVCEPWMKGKKRAVYL
jgi:NADPH:quinone reductase-like Zn-dependent oxidoreductase